MVLIYARRFRGISRVHMSVFLTHLTNSPKGEGGLQEAMYIRQPRAGSETGRSPESGNHQESISYTAVISSRNTR